MLEIVCPCQGLHVSAASPLSTSDLRLFRQPEPEVRWQRWVTHIHVSGCFPFFGEQMTMFPSFCQPCDRSFPSSCHHDRAGTPLCSSKQNPVVKVLTGRRVMEKKLTETHKKKKSPFDQGNLSWQKSRSWSIRSSGAVGSPGAGPRDTLQGDCLVPGSRAQAGVLT